MSYATYVPPVKGAPSGVGRTQRDPGLGPRASPMERREPVTVGRRPPLLPRFAVGHSDPGIAGSDGIPAEAPAMIDRRCAARQERPMRRWPSFNYTRGAAGRFTLDQRTQAAPRSPATRSVRTPAPPIASVLDAPPSTGP